MHSTRIDDPLCGNCHHPRSEHSEEMPYECMNADMCDCPGFSYTSAVWHEPWRKIENDIKHLEDMGVWPNGIVPDWAVRASLEYHCRVASEAVIKWGLKEIIRQLKIGLDKPVGI